MLGALEIGPFTLFSFEGRPPVDQNGIRSVLQVIRERESKSGSCHRDAPRIAVKPLCSQPQQLAQLSPGQCFVEIIPSTSDTTRVRSVEITSLRCVIENTACSTSQRGMPFMQ